MAFWVELHCDIKRGRGWPHPICRSHANENPGILVGDNFRIARAFVQGEARSRGWKKKSGEWVCDNCLKPSESGASNE